jgi:tetratricopeptide (TPR) repeat protein
MLIGDDFDDDSVEPDQPNISAKVVEQALKLLLYVGAPKQLPKALLNLALVSKLAKDPTLPPMDEKRQYVLETLLTDIVKEEYARVRAVNELPPLPQSLTKSQALADLAELSRLQRDTTERSELIGCAILYYQYVFVDVGFEEVSIGDALFMIDKTRRRHTQRGLQRIIKVLAKQEQVARAEFLRDQLKLELPQPPPWGVIGHGAWLTEVMSLLTQPARLLITGAPGIGKRTMARALAFRLIELGRVHRVLRVKKPKDAEEFRNCIVDKVIQDYGTLHDLRTYLQHARMVILVENAELMLNDSDALEDLLREIDVATVIMTSIALVPQSQIDAQRTLPPLDEEDMVKLGRRMWSQLQSDEYVEGEIEGLVTRAGGNPKHLHALIQGYRVTQEQTFNRETLQQHSAHLFNLLTTRGQLAWSTLALMPEEGGFVDDIAAIWGDDIAYEGIDELRRYSVANTAALPHHFTLVGGFSAWMLAMWDEQSQPWATCLTRVDDALVNGVASAVRLVTSCLARDDMSLSDARRREWLTQGWWQGVAQHERVAWLGLLRAATDGAFADEPRLWLGRGVCARGLTLWSESAVAFEQAIALTGAIETQDFGLQSEVLLERGILRRMIGDYDLAFKDFTKARSDGARYKLPALVERASLEQAQVALDVRRGADALEWLRGIGQSARQLLIEGEAHILNGAPQVGISCAEAGLALLDGDLRAQGRAYALMGRGLTATGDYEAARLAFDQAIMLLERVEDAYHLARVYTNLGAMLTAQGADARIILRMYEHAATEQRRLGDLVGLRTTQHNIALLIARM